MCKDEELEELKKDIAENSRQLDSDVERVIYENLSEVFA